MHDHSHHSHNHLHSHSHGEEPGNKRALIISLFVTAGIMILEFLGGLFTNSLALLSDAGHMLSDTGSLALSLAAVYLAAKPLSSQKTYGYYRFEILAALANGVTLFAIAGIIIWEAAERFSAPPPVNSTYMMGIALIGLLANLLSAWTLHSHGDVEDNINLKSAYLHVLGDALGSVGAIGAGLLMYFFGWYTADPIISVLVALLILRGAWRVIDDAVHILLEGTPPTLDWEQVKAALTNLAGVKEVHDLHIWTITSGRDSLTCHLLVEKDVDTQVLLQQAICLLEEQFRIKHATIQIETEDFHHHSCEI